MSVPNQPGRGQKLSLKPKSLTSWWCVDPPELQGTKQSSCVFVTVVVVVVSVELAEQTLLV